MALSVAAGMIEYVELERARARIAELEAALEASTRARQPNTGECARVAAEAARMGVWSWDSAGDVFALDSTSARMLGWPAVATRISFQQCLAALHPDDHPLLEDAARVFSSSGTLEDIEVRVVLPNGDVRWLLLSGKQSASERLFLIGCLFDVTDRRRLEEQLRQAQKMEAVGELTAGIAHNFNNLLTAIIPGIQLARREAKGAAGDRLRDAEYAASRAAELVRQLMVFARHDKGTTTAPVDVCELMQRTLAMCRATFDRTFDLEIAESPNLPSVMGDAGQLEQVFLNICLNARDALESSGSREPSIRIQLDTTNGETMREQRDWVRVRITDNGAGMSEGVRARIFEPFFTTKEIGRGTGLGLATAYAIVSDHEGRLLCESTLGSGTTFTVLLPACARNARPSRVPKRRHPGGSETVLVIDDERLVRNAVRGVLEPMGYTVREATDGESGLALFQRERDRIDLVLLDMTTPDIAGETVFANLRADAPRAKIVLFTAYRTLSLPKGAAGMLQKPFDLDELLRVVREVCDAPLAASKTGHT